MSRSTLVGAVRDGDVIRWDWDIEVAVRSEPFEGRMDELAGFVRDSVYELRAYRRRGARKLRRDSVTFERFFTRRPPSHSGAASTRASARSASLSSAAPEIGVRLSGPPRSLTTRRPSASAVQRWFSRLVRR